MKVTTKVLSLVLALAMLLTMASFPAFAANIDVSYEYEVGKTYVIPIEVIAGEKVTKVYDITGLIVFGTPRPVDGVSTLWFVEAKMNTKGITKIVVEYTDVNEEDQEIVSNYVEIVDPADEPTTVDVTFVDVDGANDDVVKTIDAGATVTIPDVYAEGYKFYSDADCTEEITDLATRTFAENDIIYVKAIPVTPDPQPPVEYTPKTVEFVRTGASSKINYHNSNVAFTLPDVDLYVGDSIKFPENFFTDNTFYFGTTELSYLTVQIRKSGEENYVLLDPKSENNTYTFSSEGIYTIRLASVYNTENVDVTGISNTFFFGTFEVKDPENKKTAEKPTTEKTYGRELSFTSANIRYTDRAFIGTSELKTADILYPNDVSIATALPAGTVVDWNMEFDQTGYIDTVSWTASSEDCYTAVDVYGSLDGENWYLLADDSPVTSESDLFSVSVKGVAKYLRFRNFKYTYRCVSQYISMSKVTGFSIEEYVPKIVEFVKTGADSKINYHNSNVAFTLPDVDLYVGDSIKFPENFFTDNSFYFNSTRLGYLTVQIRKSGEENFVPLDPKGENDTYTFSSEGIYTIRLQNIYNTRNEDITGESTTFFFGAFEVKDYDKIKVVEEPAVEQTSEDYIYLLNANIRYTDKPFVGTSEVKTADILNSSDTSIATALPAGTVVDWNFELDNTGYVELICWVASNEDCYTAVDVYGSLNGEDWYLLADDQAVHREDGVFNLHVKGVAKYLKLKNFKYTDRCVSQNIQPATVSGYKVSEQLTPEDWSEIQISLFDVTGQKKNPFLKTVLNRNRTVALEDVYILGCNFYTDRECENQIDITTTKFTQSTTLYVEPKDLTRPFPEVYSFVTPEGAGWTATVNYLADLHTVVHGPLSPYLVTRWQMEDANGVKHDVEYTFLKKANLLKDITGDIHISGIQLPLKGLGIFTQKAEKAGEDGTGAFAVNSYYENGLYLQGAQIRFANPETNTTAGLRFVNVVDREFEQELLYLQEQGVISNLDHGVLSAAGVDYDYIDLDIDSAKNVNWGDAIYKSSDLYNDQYYKYTLCVTGFKPEHYKLDIYVRSVIKFDYNGQTIYLYGEQYKTNYREVVEEAYDQYKAGNETLSDADLAYCKEILGIGQDNDVDSDDIF